MTAKPIRAAPHIIVDESRFFASALPLGAASLRGSKVFEVDWVSILEIEVHHQQVQPNKVLIVRPKVSSYFANFALEFGNFSTVVQAELVRSDGLAVRFPGLVQTGLTTSICS